MDFEPLPRRTVTMDAVNRIKEMILDGRLAPGERLPSERTLSELLGVSRPTIREAIRSLVAMHILEVRQGSGTFVSSLSMDQLFRPIQFAIALSDTGIADLFDVRMLLEPGAARFAAQRGTDAELRAIEERADLARQHQDDYQEFARLDFDLHRLIVEASHNGLLVNLHESIGALTLESRTITVQLPGVTERTAEDHAGIARAILARDAAAAERAMRQHLEHVLEAAMAALDGRAETAASSNSSAR